MTLLRRFYLIFFSGSLKAMLAIGCCCHVCGDLSLQRQRIKRLLLSLEREHSGVKSSMLRALANVAPRHCIDTRLHPVKELRAQSLTQLKFHEDRSETVLTE